MNRTELQSLIAPFIDNAQGTFVAMGFVDKYTHAITNELEAEKAEIARLQKLNDDLLHGIHAAIKDNHPKDFLSGLLNHLGESEAGNG